jgi:hypothetical protein
VCQRAALAMSFGLQWPLAGRNTASSSSSSSSSSAAAAASASPVLLPPSSPAPPLALLLPARQQQAAGGGSCAPSVPEGASLPAAPCSLGADGQASQQRRNAAGVLPSDTVLCPSSGAGKKQNQQQHQKGGVGGGAAGKRASAKPLTPPAQPGRRLGLFSDGMVSECSISDGASSARASRPTPSARHSGAARVGFVAVGGASSGVGGNSTGSTNSSTGRGHGYSSLGSSSSSLLGPSAGPASSRGHRLARRSSGQNLRVARRNSTEGHGLTRLL